MKIGYARVSTEDQSLDLQLDALTAAGCEAIYKDHGVSGVKSNRHGLDAAIKATGKNDVFMVWKLDRLGRSLGFLIQLVDTLRERGAGFCSLTDGIDTTTPSGKLVFHIMGALAEFERELIRERTKAGMLAAKERGTILGRPRKLTINQIKQAYALHKNGMTLTDLAPRFGVDRSTLSRAIAAINDTCH
ncbi:recombinase family protein [Kordiimonas sp. SCSIO 12603]|jgi:DNA invertase Pin-like site-specific DNA recombinase|uniref:recombinase family protein n=2 Tax=Kordiimonas TaxID=288021 RepID=UPI0021029372|nr:recombinase family protein [Kordiimonas sp. SCSIO 12603]UTW59289.1 recombinase family protein [Kordiimonas sp. SCSIO 12603]